MNGEQLVIIQRALDHALSDGTVLKQIESEGYKAEEIVDAFVTLGAETGTDSLIELADFD